MEESVPVWELRNVTKRFPGVVANDSVSLSLVAGRIHGLLGENGCGKSTLVKVLCGVHQPDSGEILCAGQPVVLSDPIAARRAGIATVFQEFSLVQTLSVAENIYLGRLPGNRWRIDWPAMREGARRVLGRIHVAIDPDAIVGELSTAGQQLVEIAKAIAANASMIILDEPTTALGPDEIAELHRLLLRLRDDGRIILYISHRLDEVVELVDEATILKDGRVVSNAAETPVEISAIVLKMVGRVDEHFPKAANATGDALLDVRSIHTSNRVAGASFTVGRGEVFGLGGVLGSGRTEIARALFGVDVLRQGEIRLRGKSLKLLSSRDAIAAGIALVPENRKSDGLFFNFSGLENISIAGLGRITRGAMLDHARERRLAHGLIRSLRITPTAGTALVGELSGGNQQKIVIARWLFAEAELFVLDEPTQGIDVGAKIAVYQLINELTAAGKGVILISSDYDELLAMSDRIGIVSRGRIVAIRDARSLDKADLVKASADQEELAA
ncbi:sugar ABC transporter ATP-binding protein [Mesorhizobium onobrychidis]|uniref:Sugar ABC transporter ATP-binding protein n=1 Tax=Mesorhizobium onobrychidis TaxID=2775404 RepID=A0ABY5R2P2_9HYPH|nr:sugar ABC transporter ATP-binding protein [Mesorhizobium onobrychidis]